LALRDEKANVLFAGRPNKKCDKNKHQWDGVRIDQENGSRVLKKMNR